MFNANKTDIPFYDMMLKNPNYYKREKGVRGEVQQMSPAEYLLKVAAIHNVPPERTRAVLSMYHVKKYAGQMKDGDTFPMPVLDYAKKTQEGRHRAMAAEMAGVPIIPVLVVYPSEEPKRVPARVPSIGYYAGNWNPGDIAIYSDFGMRSLFIVRVVEWPEGEGDRITTHFGSEAIFGSITHDRADGIVRAEVIDTTLVNWDFPWGGKVSKHQEEGTIHYYHYSNLYRDIDELIEKESRVLFPEVKVRMLSDLRKHPGWTMLAVYGLRGETAEYAPDTGEKLR